MEASSIKVKSQTASAIRKRQWRVDYPEKYLKSNREACWKQLGIDIDLANELRANHKVCELCKLPGKLHIDHCHESRLIRGVLCSKCNRGIGFFHNNPELLRKAAVYLDKFYTFECG